MDIRGLVKTPNPFKWFFHTLSFFPHRCSKRWLHTLTKGFTWARIRRRKRKGKERIGKGEEKERERKRKEIGPNRKGKKERKKERKRKRKGKEKGEERERNRAVSHTDHFCCQKLSFSLSFCYRSWILSTFLFSGNGFNHQKRSVATTYQAPSLCKIWHALVGAQLWQQTMKWRKQKH